MSGNETCNQQDANYDSLLKSVYTGWHLMDSHQLLIELTILLSQPNHNNQERAASNNGRRLLASILLLAETYNLSSPEE